MFGNIKKILQETREGSLKVQKKKFLNRGEECSKP